MVVDVAEHGGFDKPAAIQAGRPTAAGGQRRSLLLPRSDKAVDGVELTFHGHRPHVDGFIELVANPDFRELRTEGLDQLIMPMLADDYPGQCRTDLAGQFRRRRGQRRGRRAEVVVIENQGRRLATELEVHPGHALGTDPGDPLPRPAP